MNTTPEHKEKVIRFSHNYPKLHGQTSARLVNVSTILIDENTPKEFLDYDTVYDGGRYPLRKGKYLQLTFIGNLNIPFCTCRSAFPDWKIKYYILSVGETFKVEVNEVDK